MVLRDITSFKHAITVKFPTEKWSTPNKCIMPQGPCIKRLTFHYIVVNK